LPFFRQFYACPFPLYFLKVSKHGDFIVISFEYGTQQGNPLGGMLFTLVHLCALHPTLVTHLTCVFLSLVDDKHIIGLALDVLPIFLQL
jgi:hypothetical protein